MHSMAHGAATGSGACGFCSAITRGANETARQGLESHALRSKARSPDSATMPYCAGNCRCTGIRHCEPPVSGPIPHTDLEQRFGTAIATSLCNDDHRGSLCNPEVMECFTTFAMTQRNCLWTSPEWVPKNLHK